MGRIPRTGRPLGLGGKFCGFPEFSHAMKHTAHPVANTAVVESTCDSSSPNILERMKNNAKNIINILFIG